MECTREHGYHPANGYVRYDHRSLFDTQGGATIEYTGTLSRNYYFYSLLAAQDIGAQGAPSSDRAVDSAREALEGARAMLVSFPLPRVSKSWVANKNYK